MKLKSLHIVNLRNHADSTLELDQPFCVVKGGNFQGKSSIAQAISLLLTPSTDNLDSQGRGFVSKIKRGEKKAVITGQIQGKTHLIERTVTLNVNTSGRTDSSRCIDSPDWHPSPFEKILEANKEALGVALNTNRFLTMDEKAQKSLLAKLALPAKYDFPADKIKAVEAAIGEGAIDFTGDPFGVIDKAYKKLYDERQLVNRQVKDFVIPETLGVVEECNSVDLQRKVDYAKDVRQKIATERNDAIKAQNYVEVKRARLAAKIEQLETSVREGQSQSKAATERMVAEAKLKELRKTADNKAALDTMMADRAMLLADIKAKTAEMQEYSNAVEIGTECPTCGQAIDKTKIKTLVDGVAKAIHDLRKDDNLLLDKMKALGDVEGTIKAISEHEIAARDRNTLEALIAEKMKQLKDAGNEMKKLPQEPTDTARFEAPLAEADEAVNKLTMALRPVIAAEEREKEIKVKTEQLNRLKDKATSLDDLVKYFGKDGLKATLLKDHIGGFEEKLNAVLGAWEYRVSLAIEPDFEFMVTDAKGITTPFKELSGSESLFFLIALQTAVSRAAGIGMVVADKMDTFLPDKRQKAMGCLYKAVKSGILEQAILIMSDDSKEVPKVPNSAYFFVENGTVTRL